MFSVAPERPLAPLTLEVLTLVDRLAHDLPLEYFVAGATARDILLYHVFGIEIGRATLDVDLGIALDSWAQFDMIKARLVETGELTTDDRTPHRLFYRRTSRHRGYPLDLLPFGGVEQSPHTIAWPPDLSIVMNVAGYREALAAAHPVEVRRGFVVPVVSLPALAILKVLAWDDRGAENPKDALDLATLLRRYHEAGNEDRLFGEEFDLFEASDHNIDRAAPHLLGKDAARIITPATRQQVVAVLADTARQSKLVKDMAKGFWGTEDPIAEAEVTISRFRMGLEGA
jgi:predicted nucleotidyltransferase